MTKSFTSRPLVAGAIAFTAATAMTSAAAIAACGGAPTLVALSGLVGPPSITATEASTDQALELIRKRREEASGSCPAGFTRAGGNCVPANQPQQASTVAQAPPAQQAPVTVTTTTTTGQQAASPPAAAPAGGVSRPRPKQVASASAPAQAAAPSGGSAGYSGGSLKDGAYEIAMPGTIRARGAWLEGYYDYEKHDNLNPTAGPQGNPTRRMVSGGVVSGVDVSEYTTGSMVRGYQFGLIGGYNSTRSKFSDTITNKLQGNGTLNLTQTTNSRQEIDGAFTGMYAAMVHGKFSADVAVKIDFFDMEQSFTDRLLEGCNTVTQRFDRTTMTNYTTASNLNYRFDMSGNHYLEPTVGVRYTYSDFGSNAPALGVRDGEAFRVQGGLRLGSRFVTPDGWIWNTSLTGLLYSDVSISGFVVNGGTLGVIPQVDEGKLRAMGILEARADVGYGYSLYGAAEVRGGEDVIGFGARAGVRYQW